MKKIKLRLGPNGEVQHLYDDTLSSITMDLCKDVEVQRASDVFFDNELKKWRIKLLTDPWKGRVLSRSFKTRSEAIAYEIKILEKIPSSWSRIEAA